MTGRRKGTPCACETDPCSCGSSKGKCIRTINNLSPDPNGDFFIEAGSGITITQTGDNSFEVSFDGTLPSNPLIYKGTVGSGGTVAVLPAADPDNIGWMYIAIEAATSPVTYEVGDTLISDGYTWQVIPSGDDPVDWSQILNTPTTLAGYGITDAMQADTTPGVWAYTHSGVYQGQTAVAGNAAANSLLTRDSDGCGQVADPAADTDSDYAVNVRTLNRRLTDGSVSKIGTSNLGTDTKPIKLVGGVPTVVTNELVDLPSAQAITGIKDVPLEATSTFSNQIASSNKVKNELDNYASMVRTTGNQTLNGIKSINSANIKVGPNTRVTGTSRIELLRFRILEAGTYTLKNLLTSRGPTTIMEINITIDSNIEVSTASASKTVLQPVGNTETIYTYVYTVTVNGEKYCIVGTGNESSRNWIYSNINLLSYTGAGINLNIDVTNAGRSITTESTSATDIQVIST